MSIELQKIQRLAVYIEPAGSYAVDNSATPAAFLDVPAIEGSMSWNPGRQFQERSVLQQYSYSYDISVRGWDRPTLSFQVPLAPTGIIANSSTSSADEDDSGLLRLLKATFGNLLGNVAGSTVSGTPTSAAVFDVGTGHGSRFTTRMGVGVTTSTGILECREILSVATDTLTLRHRGSFTPAASSVVHNATTVYMKDDPDTSLQFIVEGAEQDDRWVLLGMQCTSISLETPDAGFPMLSFEFMGAGYSKLSAQAITAATYSSFDPQWKLWKCFTTAFTASTGDLTATDRCIQSRSISLNMSYEPLACTAATYGIQRMKLNRTQPIEVKFTLPYEDNTWRAAAEAQSEYFWSQQWGTEPGKTVTVAFPRLRVTDCVRTGDVFAQQEVTGRALIETASAPLTDGKQSPIRIHFC